MQETSRVIKNQRFILNKFIQYLEIKKSWTQADFDRRGIDGIDIEEINSKIQALKNGFCFGFMVKDFVKKNKRLESYYGINYISQWDGSKESLFEKTQLYQENPGETLEDLFENTINDITLAQATMLWVSTRQVEYIKPPLSDNQDEPLRFEVITDSGERKFFKSHAVTAGNFSKKELEQIWPSKSQAANDLVQISIAGCHSISISYVAEAEVWRLYDSNNDHSLTSCRFMFSYATLSKGIIDSLKKNSCATYYCNADELYYVHPQIGEAIKIPVNKEKIKQILSIINKHYDVRRDLTYAELCQIRNLSGHTHYINGKFFSDKSACAEAVLKILDRHIKNTESLKSISMSISSFEETIIAPEIPFSSKRLKNCGLHAIAQNMGETEINKILALASDDHEIREAFAKAFVRPNKKQLTGLHMIAQYSPAGLQELWTLAERHPEIRKAIAKALVMVEETQWTGLHMIASYSPASLQGLWTLAERHPEIRKVLAEALVMSNKDQWTGLHMIVRYSPASLQGLWVLAESYPKIRQAIAKALVSSNNTQSTGLHMIASYSPSSLQGLWVLAERHPEIRKAIAEALVSSNNTQSTGLHMIARYSPASLQGLWALAESYPKIREAIAKALMTFDDAQWTGLHMIARYSPASLQGLWALAERHPEITEAIAEALVMSNKNQWTGLHMIAYCSRASLQNLWDLAKNSPLLLKALINAMQINKKEIAVHLPEDLKLLDSLVEDPLRWCKLSEEKIHVWVMFVETFSTMLPDVVLKTLPTKNSQNMTALEAIYRCDSTAFYNLLNKTPKDSASQNFIVNLLSTKTEDGYSLHEKMIKDSSHNTNALIKKEARLCLANFFTASSLSANSVDMEVEYYSYTESKRNTFFAEKKRKREEDVYTQQNNVVKGSVKISKQSPPSKRPKIVNG